MVAACETVAYCRGASWRVGLIRDREGLLRERGLITKRERGA